MELGRPSAADAVRRRAALARSGCGAAVDAARDCGFAAVSANDHFVFQTPWLDGPTALASVIERSGELALATTVSLAVAARPGAAGQGAGRDRHPLRRPAGRGPRAGVLPARLRGRRRPLRGALEALRRGDRRAAGAARAGAVPERRALLPRAARPRARARPAAAIPLWVGSWGSKAGLARVARAGDGWLASAYNTTPERFAGARAALARQLDERGRDAEGFPNALATMWTWVTEDRAEARSRAADVLAPLLSRDPDELARAGLRRLRRALRRAARRATPRPAASASTCGRWATSARQLELWRSAVAPQVDDGGSRIRTCEG